MSTHHSRRMTRNAAERLLDGAAVPGADAGHELSRVLAAAAAPGHESELAGEATAVAAFEAHHLVSVSAPRRGQMIKSPLARLLTAKVLGAALAVLATGGVALAATTGVLSGPASSPGHPASPQAAGPGTGQASSPHHAGLLGPQRLCREAATQVASLPSAQVTANVASQAGLEQALASPAFGQVVSGSGYTSLVGTASVSGAVPDYCALLLGLPRLPQPADLSRLPVPLLTELLPALPASALAPILTAMPAGTLAAVLGELPATALGPVLTTLPAGALSQVLTTLPASGLTPVLTTLPAGPLSQVLTTLPAPGLATVLTTLPAGGQSQVLTTLPAAGLSRVLTTLPATGLASVLTTLPAGSLSQVLGELPAPVMSSLLGELPTSVLPQVLAGLPSSLLGELPPSLLSHLPG